MVGSLRQRTALHQVGVLFILVDISPVVHLGVNLRDDEPSEVEAHQTCDEDRCVPLVAEHLYIGQVRKRFAGAFVVAVKRGCDRDVLLKELGGHD
eukprot:5331794-Prymnesium_polylepis.1